MTVGIVGLGLIGGSFAKAYHEAGWQVLARDADQNTLDFAKLSGAVDSELTDDKLPACDLILLAAYPAASISYFKEKAHLMGGHPVVIDCCGTKRVVCAACFPVARENGVTFLGGHPMAGTAQLRLQIRPGQSVPQRPHGAGAHGPGRHRPAGPGEGAARPPRASGASPSPPPGSTTEMIAFTSQMAHVVSNGYIKSPTAGAHKGFSAGSYKDMTRVAWLAPEMWAELFLENKDFLLKELDFFMSSMQQYRDALAADDQQELVRLLDEGRKRKAEVDGR